MLEMLEKCQKLESLGGRLLKRKQYDLIPFLTRKHLKNILGMPRSARGCQRAIKSVAWWCEFTQFITIGEKHQPLDLSHDFKDKCLKMLLE